MTDERLSLSELTERAKALGYTKIQRMYTSAKVALGFLEWIHNRNRSAYQHVESWYLLNGNRVTVFKNGKQEAHYVLS